MKNFKLHLFLGLISVIAFSITSCSDDVDKPTPKVEATGDHVWKNQTDALQSAKDMAKKMKESMKQQQENMEKNN